MCDVCGSTYGHKPGCPEAEDAEPETIGFCSLCGDKIVDGEDYFDIDDTKHHYDCFCDEYLKRG